MRVTSVQLSNFTSHGQSAVTYPGAGVVLVTGPNGAGKSSLVEAVAWCLWGETLRGTAPFTDLNCHVQVALEVRGDHLVVHRERAKGKTTLRWSPNDSAGSSWTGYETATKAQEAMEAVVGSFDAWRRTHVFSASEAGCFTAATDGERKRLLEEVLGLGRFDPALEACRTDMREAQREMNRCSSTANSLTGRLDALRSRQQDAQETLKRSWAEGHGAPQASAQQLRGDLLGLDRELAELSKLVTGLSSAGAVQEAAEAAARRRLERMGDECDACGQPVAQATRQRMAGEVEEARRAAVDARAAAATALGSARAEAAERQAERSALDGRLRRLEGEQEADARLARVRSGAQQAADQAASETARLQGELDAVLPKLRAAQALYNVLEATEAVLGMRGVRAHVLGRALGGLESVANSWLGRVCGEGLRLRVRPYTERKAGGTSDAIGVEVLGAGGGLGYRAASGGERRRVDVALTLALAEVSAAAAGTQPGTLFCDEVFDAVHQDAHPMLADALQEMAGGRCVVVVTHNEALGKVLKPAQHWRVDAGRVAVVQGGDKTTIRGG